MRNFLKQAVLTAFTVLLLLLAGYKSTAQQQIPKADNTIHDRMYYLIQKSQAVVLPAEVSQHITTINADNPKKAKAVYSQANALKVLYNSNVSKEDKLFFGNQMLKSSSATIIAIHPDIKKLLSNL